MSHMDSLSRQTQLLPSIEKIEYQESDFIKVCSEPSDGPNEYSSEPSADINDTVLREYPCEPCADYVDCCIDDKLPREYPCDKGFDNTDRRVESRLPSFETCESN